METDYKFPKLRLIYFVLSNLPIIIALILLSLSPVYILQNEIEIANQNAGYALYFLIVGLLWKVIQYVFKIYPRKDNILPKDRKQKLESG